MIVLTLIHFILCTNIQSEQKRTVIVTCVSKVYKHLAYMHCMYTNLQNSKVKANTSKCCVEYELGTVLALGTKNCPDIDYNLECKS